MEDELIAEHLSAEYAYAGNAVPRPHMPLIGALLFGAWYSIVLALAMSAGVKYLHPETPAAHGVLHSLAWALGAGIGIALASRMSKSHGLIVGISSTVISSGVWVGLLYLLRNDLDQQSGNSIFGYELSLKTYFVVLTVLSVIIGMVSSFLGASSQDDEEIAGPFILVPNQHWLWLWIPAFAWMSMVPIVLYYLWLQFATALYSIIHPSLWFQLGSGICFGILGIAALLKGIEMSLRSLSDRTSYGGFVWKRILMFLFGTLILASVVSPILLNLDIHRFKDMPSSLGAHPWWVL